MRCTTISAFPVIRDSFFSSLRSTAILVVRCCWIRDSIDSASCRSLTRPLPDLVEAAARAGRPEIAETAATRLAGYAADDAPLRAAHLDVAAVFFADVVNIGPFLPLTG